MISIVDIVKICFILLPAIFQYSRAIQLPVKEELKNVEGNFHKSVYRFLPLGYPAKITCIDTNIINLPKDYNISWEWTKRDGDIEFADNSSFFIMSSVNLFLPIATFDFDDTVIDCHIFDENGLDINNRFHIEIQDCNSRPPLDTVSYNLHDPCAFGKCSVSNQTAKVECECFKQYTGVFCTHYKSLGFIWDALSFSIMLIISMLVLLVTCICRTCFPWSSSEDEKVMLIANHVIPLDRENLCHKFLFRADTVTQEHVDVHKERKVDPKTENSEKEHSSMQPQSSAIAMNGAKARSDENLKKDADNQTRNNAKKSTKSTAKAAATSAKSNNKLTKTTSVKTKTTVTTKTLKSGNKGKSLKKKPSDEKSLKADSTQDGNDRL